MGALPRAAGCFGAEYRQCVGTEKSVPLFVVLLKKKCYSRQDEEKEFMPEKI